ncbi:MAG: hypothetical protein MZV70_73320 [Desulfobacterales bacterium]|nr:hypothetical protein [Desulfobacterales bacterium]
MDGVRQRQAGHALRHEARRCLGYRRRQPSSACSLHAVAGGGAVKAIAVEGAAQPQQEGPGLAAACHCGLRRQGRALGTP